MKIAKLFTSVGALVLVVLTGCDSVANSMQEYASVNKAFRAQDYQRVKTMVEGMNHDAHRDPYLYDIYCNALRELRLPYNFNGITTARPDLKSYVSAACNLVYGRLDSAQKLFTEMLNDDRTMNLAYYGLLEYAATTGSSIYIREILSAIRALPEKPGYLVASERFHSIRLSYLLGEFESMESEFIALSQDDLENYGFPNFLIAPLTRRNAFEEARQYVAKGIAALGPNQQLYALKADIIFLTQGRNPSLDWLTTMIKQYPGMWELEYVRALRLLEAGNQEDSTKAIKLIQGIVEQRPNDFEFLIDAAHMLLDHKKWDSAKRVIDMIATYGNELDSSVEYKVFRARGYFFEGRDSDAMEILKEVVAVSPYHIRANALLVEFGSDKKGCIEQSDALERLLSLDPWNVNTLSSLADIAQDAPGNCCGEKYALTHLSMANERHVPAELKKRSSSRLSALDKKCAACNLEKVPKLRGCTSRKQ